jgi:hypothetical protein
VKVHFGLSEQATPKWIALELRTQFIISINDQQNTFAICALTPFAGLFWVSFPIASL